MAGFMDFLTQGTPAQNVTSTGSTLNNMPAWYNQYLQSLSNYAGAVTAEPFQAYSGPRVAPMSGLQQQAQQYGSDSAMSWQPFANQAAQSFQQGSQPFSAGGLKQFMDPYQDNVVERIAELGNRNFQENTLGTLRSEFTGSGQFGSQRHMDLAARGARDSQEAISMAQGQALSGGFQNAMQNYGGWQDRALTAGAGLSQFAADRQGMDTRTVAGLDALGQNQQLQDQRNLDTAYGDFQEQRNYPVRNLQIMQGALQGAQMPSSSTSTTNGPASSYAPSPLSQIASLYALYRGTQAKKRGGRIKRPGAVSLSRSPLMKMRPYYAS